MATNDTPMTDLEAMLPPPEITSALTESTTANRASRASFNAVLRTPFLQEIRIGAPIHSTANPNVTMAKIVPRGQTILPLLTDGLTTFAASQLIDVGIARKLSSYANSIPLLAKHLPRGQLASTLMGMNQRYVQEANKKANDSKKLLSKFLDTVQNISDTIDNMDQDLDLLREDVSQAKDELSAAEEETSKMLLMRIRKRMGKHMHLPNSSEESLLSSLALLFSVTSEELKKTLESKDKIAAIEEMLAKLKDLQKRLRDVRLLLTSLRDNLLTVSKQSIVLMTAWFRILQNVEILQKSSSPEEKFDESELHKISTGWDQLRAAAVDFSKAVSDTAVEDVNAAVQVNREVVSRSVKYAKKVSRILAVPRDLSKDEKKLVDATTTDEETIKALDNMTESTGSIVSKFNDLLRTPHLDSLLVSSNAVTGIEADGSGAGSENAQVDLETLTLRYLQRYQKLQAETIPVARDLYGYASLQQTLIPTLGAQLSVENYVNANLSIITRRQEQASEVHAKHNKFQQDWNTAILLVERAIGEQESSIGGLRAQLEDLRKQKRKMTISAILTTILGTGLLAAAAFATGGLATVAFAAVGLGLVASGVSFSVQSSDISKMIEATKIMLNTAKTTVSRLETVLPVMVEIREYLTKVTGVWNEISLKLNDMQTFVEAWSEEEIAALFLIGAAEGFKNEALKSWDVVKTKVQEYTEIVSDANPEAK